jgi:hypothetical protein
MATYICDDENGRIFLTGDMGPHCSDCAWVGELLCDYPVGDGKTCDRTVCVKHGYEGAPDIHYCKSHYEEWKEFFKKGAVLENVVPLIFNKEPKK